jgi:hypothetical protein
LAFSCLSISKYHSPFNISTAVGTFYQTES